MIFINGRFLTQKITGVNRYAIGICDAFKELNVEFTVILPKWFKGTCNYPYITYGSLPSHLWEQVNLYAFVKKNNNPLLLNFTGLGPVYYKNQFSTIHDLSFLRHPEWFNYKYRLFYGLLTPIMARNVKRIITVSEFSKSEIIKLLNIKPEKIFVAGLAPSKITNDLNNETLSYNIPRKYILAVSSIEPRKNFKRLLDAFSRINDKQFYLVVAGSRASHFTMESIDVSTTAKIIFKGYVSDAELSYLYKNATLFIYPSLYEGFGIPPLEAMQHGCPVITSDIEVLQETCGNAAYYTNPYNEQAIANAINNVIEDDKLRSRLTEAGEQNILRFSFKKSAKKILDAMQPR